MRKDFALLVGLLVASNAAWAWFAFGQPRAEPEPGTPAQEEVAALRERVRELEAAREAAGPALAGAKSAPTAAPEPLKTERVDLSSPPAGAPAANELLEVAQRSREDLQRLRQREKEVGVQAEAWQRDALQVADAAKRADALRAIEGALLSSDPVLASAGLRSVPPLRSLGQDLARFRPLVVTRLGDEDAKVRGNAAWALANLPREDGDLERLLARFDEAATDRQAFLMAALSLNGGKAEGAVGNVFVRLLADADKRRAMDVANLLRSFWVSAEVEDAVLAAWKLRDPGEPRWPYVLGQMRPTREPRLRAIVAWILDPAMEHQMDLLGPALTRNVDEPLRPLAATLALETLPGGMSPSARRLLLQAVRANGTAEHAPAVRAFSENSMLAEDLRAFAKRIAEELEKKKP